MPDSLALDGVGLRSSPSLSEAPSITVLVELLEQALEATGEVEPVLFPSDIVRSLLRTEDQCIDSHHFGRITSILDNHREQIIRNLHWSSLNCLICVLLKSDSPADQERALHILLDGGKIQENMTADDRQEALSASPSSSRLTEDSLVAALYAKFVGNKEDIRCRIWAGKLLLEILEKSRNQLGLLRQQGLLSVFLHEMDVTLRFFAGAVIRFLHISGANEEVIWPQDNTAGRHIFFRNLQLFPNDWIQSFCHYSHGAESDLSDSASMRSVEVRGTTATKVDNYRPSIYLIQSVALGKRSYLAEQVLVTTSSEALVFIAPTKGTNSESFHLVEVPLQYILYSETDPDKIGISVSSWRVHLHTEGFFLANGKKQHLDGSTLFMDSAYDLTGLMVQIKTLQQIDPNPATITERSRMGRTGTQASVSTTQRKCSKALVSLVSDDLAVDSPLPVGTATCDNTDRSFTIVKPRRTSSMIVPLDSGEEVATKSMQHNTEVLQTGDELSPNVDDDNNNNNNNKDDSLKSDLTSTANWMIAGSENANEEPGVSAKESRLIDNPSDADPVSSKKTSRTEENDARFPAPVRERWDEKDVGGRKGECHGVDGSLQATSPHLGNVHEATLINTTHPNNAYHRQYRTVSQGDKESFQMDIVTTDNSKAALPAVQDTDEPNTKSDKMILPRGNVSTRKQRFPAPKNTRPRLQNTQESLLFPRPRRSKRKVYTTQSKAAVDWDEALRPSDDEQETRTRNSIDLTSVTSPSSSIASKKINFSGKSKTRPRGSNGRKRPAKAQNKTNPKKGTRQIPRKPLPTRRTNANKPKSGSVSLQKNKKDQSNAADVSETAKLGQPEPSEIKDSGTTLKNNYFQVLSHDPSNALSKEDCLERHVIDSSGSIASPLETGLQTAGGPEATKLTRSDSITSENDFVFLSQVETVAGASHYHMQNDVDEREDLMKPKSAVERLEQTQEGRGQTLGSKLIAAFFSDDCFSQDPKLGDSQKPNAGTSLDSVKPQESPRLPITESVKRGQCSPLAFPGSLNKRDISDECLGFAGQNETYLKYENEDISAAVESPATNVMSRGLPARSQNQTDLDGRAGCPVNTTSDRISENAISANTMGRKRSPSHDLADEFIPKKVRTGSFTVPDSRGLNQPVEISPTQDEENPNAASNSPLELEMQAGMQERPSWEMEKERYFNLRKVQSGVPDLEHDVNTDGSHISSREEVPVIPNTPRRPVPKTTVVDVNGSPRPSSRFDAQLRGPSLKGSEDESEKTCGEKLGRREISVEHDSSVSERNGSQSDIYAGGDLFIRRQRDDAVGKSRSFVERLRACVRKVEEADSPFEPKNKPLPEPSLHAATEIPEMELQKKVLTEDDSEIQQTSSITGPGSIDLGSDITGSTTFVEADENHGEWRDSLQIVQRNAHDMLINTSKLLMHHLDDERDSISRVLETYRKGCHSTLDRLFEAQEERVELHRQHMATIEKHHADLSRDLIHRLEENDRRTQQRLSFATLTQKLEERNKLQCRVEEMLNRHGNGAL